MNFVKNYSFGFLEVSDRSFNQDLIILPDEIIEKWWRKDGHHLQFDDLKIIENKKIEYLVIGTGYFGMMKVSEEIINKFEKNGIKVFCDKSQIAVKKFNELLEKNKKVVLAIHLTC